MGLDCKRIASIVSANDEAARALIQLRAQEKLPKLRSQWSAAEAVKVVVTYCNGETHKLFTHQSFVLKLMLLQSKGYTGRQLIDFLLLNDWGAAPKTVEISGKDSNGYRLSIVIPYL